MYALDETFVSWEYIVLVFNLRVGVFKKTKFVDAVLSEQ